MYMHTKSVNVVTESIPGSYEPYTGEHWDLYNHN